MKKLNRLELRRIIEETARKSLNEARFKPTGYAGSVIRYGPGVALAIPGAIFGPVSAAAGFLGGSFAGDKIANLLGYKDGAIPNDHPLALQNLVNYIEERNVTSAEQLSAYLDSITGGKYTVLYDPEDFDSIPGSDRALELIKDLDALTGGIEGVVANAYDKLATVTGAKAAHAGMEKVYDTVFGGKEKPPVEQQAKDPFINPPDSLEDFTDKPSTAKRMKKARRRRKRGRTL